MSVWVRALRGVWDSVGSTTVPQHFLDRVVGCENVPPSGPCIVVANHTSIGDILILNSVLMAIRNEPPQMLAKAEAFTRVMSVFYLAVGGIPVDRANPGFGVVESVERILEDGRVVVIFPEGKRGPGGSLLPFLNGPFVFAVRAQAPIVPAAILGSNRILPKGRVVPHGNRARVAFGRPLVPDVTLPKRARAAQLRHGSRTAIRGLLDDLAGSRWDRAQAARELTGRADAVMSGLLEGSDDASLREIRRQAIRLLRMANVNDPRSPELHALKACWDLLPMLARGRRRRLIHSANTGQRQILQQAGSTEPELRAVNAVLDRLAERSA